MDVLEAAEEYDIDMEELSKEGKKYKRKQKQRGMYTCLCLRGEPISMLALAGRAQKHRSRP